MEQFTKFYSDLNFPGVILFWSVIIFVFFLVYSLVLLLMRNKELVDIIKKMKKEGNVGYKKEETKEVKEVVQINAKTNEPAVYKQIKVTEQPKVEVKITEEPVKPEEIKEELRKEEVFTTNNKFINTTSEEPVISNDIYFPKYDEEIKEKEERTFGITPNDDIYVEPKLDSTSNRLYNTANIYQKDAFKEMKPFNQTSPIALGKHNASDIKNLESTARLEPIDISVDDKLEESKNDFVDEISSRMESEVDTSAINLNEYEKIQEEEAIISLGELEKTKELPKIPEVQEKIEPISIVPEVKEEIKELSKVEPIEEEKPAQEKSNINIEADSDDDFLKELKSFRNNL